MRPMTDADLGLEVPAIGLSDLELIAGLYQFRGFAPRHAETMPHRRVGISAHNQQHFGGKRHAA